MLMMFINEFAGIQAGSTEYKIQEDILQENNEFNNNTEVGTMVRSINVIITLIV